MIWAAAICGVSFIVGAAFISDGIATLGKHIGDGIAKAAREIADMEFR